jgi:hypothetical protein
MLLTEKFKPIIESANYASLTSSEAIAMAALLENQEKEETRLVAEGTVSGDIAQFTPILIPMVRRVYPSLIANEIAGVQPLALPTGYLYAMTSKYLGDSTNSIGSSELAQIVVVANAANYPVGGNISAASGATGVVKYVEGKNLLVKLGNATLFVKGDNVDNTVTFSATDTTVSDTFSNQAMFTKVLKNYTGPMATATAETLGDGMKEMGFNIERKSVEAMSRKLKGKYTLEMFQDMKAMHGLDAEKELMDLMAMELQLETDREMINLANATAAASGDVTISTFDGRWEIEKYRMLAIKIANESREIGRLTRKGAGNTMIVSPKVATCLDQLGSYTLAPVKSGVDSVLSGIRPQVGTFDGKYKVIVDNFAESDYVNVLYKGANNKDSGIFFLPYVGASFIKTVDPVSGQPAVILSSRYATGTNPLNPETYLRNFAVNFGSTSLA